jgi:hypothetical protein
MWVTPHHLEARMRGALESFVLLLMPCTPGGDEKISLDITLSPVICRSLI